jgi:asparagine synthase (glutamine-hydrolysing)
MCGIWSLVNLKRKNLDIAKLFQDFCQLKHRGPDSSFLETYGNVYIGFHRLAIVDSTFSSNQPLVFEDDQRTVIFICNGEIYNYKEIVEGRTLDYDDVKGDCSVIPLVYMDMVRDGHERGFSTFIRDEVKGEYAFVLFEFDSLNNLHKVIAGRDTVGVRPLYYSSDDVTEGMLFFSSEVKGGLNTCENIQEFPPGGVFTYHLNELGGVQLTKDIDDGIYDTCEGRIWSDARHLSAVQTAVMNSVRRRLSADKPLAFLLSGGVDSSLVAALGAKMLGRPIRTFCCSIRGAGGEGVGTDMKYARMVAEHIGSTHTEVLFTAKEGLAAIPDVIRTIESWDTTSVRASVGQYLVSKWIGTHTDCKVVLVGEGPDELCSSYLFNWYAPSGDALDKCAKEYVKNIHYYDVKRADRCISRWGLEGRVPLLDPEFIRAYWTIPAEKRMPTAHEMEKWYLRAAFEDSGILPEGVLWRKKEAFSDGVSGEKSWYQIIQEHVEGLVTDEEMTGAAEKYPYCTPSTKEAYYYRRVFCDIFGEGRQNIIPGFWQAKWDKDGKEIVSYTDPSARTLNIYSELDKE